MRFVDSPRVGTWTVRVVWFLLPLAAGPTFAAAFADATRAHQVLGAVLLWGGWALGLIAAAVPTTVSLTALRILGPGALVAAVLAALAGEPSALALGAGALGLVVTLGPGWTEACAQASAYGDEQRFPLRTPPVVAAVPAPLAVLAVLAGLTAGPWLLAAEVWVLGALVCVTGLAVAALAARALHGLARRWLVFVPAGVVVHDLLALTDPVLVRREAMASLGLAPVEPDALDLTLGALGAAVEIRLHPDNREVTLVRRTGANRTATPERPDALLVAPVRPGRALEAARNRRLPVPS